MCVWYEAQIAIIHYRYYSSTKNFCEYKYTSKKLDDDLVVHSPQFLLIRRFSTKFTIWCSYCFIFTIILKVIKSLQILLLIMKPSTKTMPKTLESPSQKSEPQSSSSHSSARPPPPPPPPPRNSSCLFTTSYNLFKVLLFATICFEVLITVFEHFETLNITPFQAMVNFFRLKPFSVHSLS